MSGTRTATDTVARLRLNHYHWKSKEEYVDEMRADACDRPSPRHSRAQSTSNGSARAGAARRGRDEAILPLEPPR